MIHPDMVVLIDGDSANISDDPVVRQRFRESGIEHKVRRGSLVVGRDGLREAIENMSFLQSVRCGFGRLLRFCRSGQEDRAQKAEQDSGMNKVCERFCSHVSTPICSGILLRSSLGIPLRACLIYSRGADL